MQKTLVYVILGTPGSGRRDILADLISESFTADDKVACLLSGSEKDSPADAKLGTLARWRWTADKKIEAEIPEGTRTLFFLCDSRSNPVDQMEALTAWLPANSCEMGRVLTVIDCSLVLAKPGILPWLDACIHFSDAALLNRRENVPNKWMSDFIARFEAQCLPCLFELVRKDKVRNPAAILDPQARRISQVFDEVPEDGLGNGVFKIEDDEDFDEDEEDEDLEGGESPNDEDDGPTEDPYFVRKPGGGRVKQIPDVNQFLD